jgi:hypothetical protein
MPYISIRDLQKMSSEKIARLDGPTAVKSGRDTVAILTPVRAAKPFTQPEWHAWSTNARRIYDEHRARLTPEERLREDALLEEWGVDMTVYDDEEIARIIGSAPGPAWK